MKREIVKICDWCRREIAQGAPAMHTTSVDVASLNGRGVPVASRVRNFHTLDPDCYRLSLFHQHQPTDSGSTMPAGATAAEIKEGEGVSDEVYAWERHST